MSLGNVVRNIGECTWQVTKIGAFYGGGALGAIGLGLTLGVACTNPLVFSAGIILGGAGSCKVTDLAEDLALRTYAHIKAEQANDLAEQLDDQLQQGNNKLEKNVDGLHTATANHEKVVSENIEKLNDGTEKLQTVGEQLRETQDAHAENLKSQKRATEHLGNIAQKLVDVVNPALEKKTLEQSEAITELKKELAACRQQLHEKDRNLSFALDALDDYQKKSLADDEEKIRLKKEVVLLKCREDELLKLLVNNGVQV